MRNSRSKIGLANEVAEICSKLDLEGIAACRLDSKQFRKIVTEKCHLENERRLREQTKESKKCKRIKEEKYEKRQYFEKSTLKNASKIFRTRFGMLDFAGNYKNIAKYKKTEGMCRCSQQKEQETHILSGKCEIYGDIRLKHNISDDESLMKFFSEILQRREELEEQDRTTAAPAASFLLAGGVARHTATALVATDVATSRPGDSPVQLVASL